jgi:hypothetical protein
VDTGIRIRLFAAGAPGPRTRGPRKYGHGHIVAPLRRMDIVYVEVPGGTHISVVAPQVAPMLEFFASQKKGASE